MELALNADIAVTIAVPSLRRLMWAALWFLDFQNAEKKNVAAGVILLLGAAGD
jgi:hypothetical protein